MSDPKHPEDETQDPEPRQPRPAPAGAGRSGTAGSIGAELGDLDFEPDALLDSLLTEDEAVPGRPQPSPLSAPVTSGAESRPGQKLHEPDHREFGFDDVTMTGSRESLVGLEAREPTPEPEPARVAAPPRPAAPRPDTTAKPPAVNPPGPPPRQPFPLAASPAVPEVDASGMPSLSGEPTHPFIDASVVSEAAEAAFEVVHAGTFSAAARAEGLSSDPIEVGGFDELEAADFDELDGPDAPDAAGAAAPPAARLEPRPLRAEARAQDVLWQDERPAAAHLAEQQTADEWLKRAEQAEVLARGRTEPQERARALVVASELWAMTGDSARARSVANEASAAAASLPLVHRQVRWLAAADGDFTAVASSLELESRASPTGEARVHGALLASEVQRLVLSDAAAAARKLDQAAHALPTDARAHVARIAAALATPEAEPSKLRVPESPVLAPLGEALGEIAALRSGSPSGVSTPRVLFDQSRRALARSDAPRAGALVAELARVDGLADAASWLAAALLAPGAATRPRALELLRGLTEHQRSPHLRRAIAQRALELGDASAIEDALASGDDDALGAFTAADRVALATLSGGGAATLRPLITELALDDAELPLAAAAEACTSPTGAPLALMSGGESSRTAVALGRALGSPATEPAALDAALEGYAAAHAGDAFERLLKLERALARRDADAVALGLASWPGDERVEDERDRRLAAALLRELAGDAEGTRHEYSAALRADPGAEAAVRALLDGMPGAGAANLVAGLAQSAADDAQRSLLFTEAALRRGFEDVEHFEALLDRAAEAAPTLPFAYRFGELLARQQGDVALLLRWLHRRRDSITDPIERAADQVREALLVADTDLSLAASLIEEASAARPSDVALHTLHDRLSPGPHADKGAWREQVAESLDEPLRARLFIEAALEFERAGDGASAARAALAAEAHDAGPYARIAAERLGAQASGSATLAGSLMDQARAGHDPLLQREIYQRLARLDEARGEHSSALLWQSAILEHSPDYLPALRRVEHAYITAGREDELETIAATIARLVGSGESGAHAMLAARLRSKSGNWGATRELVDLALQEDPPSLWALRQLEAHGRVSGDDQAVYRASRALGEQATRAIDAATLALRAAEAATRLEKLDEARALLERAVELVPAHLVALTTRAEVLEATGDYAGAAESLEALAASSNLPAHQLAARGHAALLWLDKVGDPERGQAALELAAELEGAGDEIFTRLQALLVASGDRAKLAALLERRIAATVDPAERVALEVTRGRALAEVGDRTAAKEALAAALDANPDHADALDVFAELSAADGDWQSAEQAWIRLARHLSEPERQAEVYRKLGDLYDDELGNPARAELSYREVLKRQPNDVGALERLVGVYSKLGQGEQAAQTAEELVSRAQSPEETRDRTIALAGVYERAQGDRRKAEATLDKARKAAPQDGVLLRAAAEFYHRGGEERALAVLLDRSAADARRALATGRFDASFFEVLGTVAELRGGADAATVAAATIAALEGREEAAVRGAGPAAGDARLDELLAPELLTLPLRALLRKAGDALDAAYPLDLRALRAAPLPAQAHEFLGHVRQVASAFGINALEVFVSPMVGPSCLPVSSNPPQIVFGTELLESPDDAARYVVLIRTLKILQAHASTIARTAPIDLWPLTAAFLGVFATNWQPQGVDAKRFAEARQRIQPAIPRNLDDDVPILALEVIGSIGNRASQLATTVNQWGNRAALLAIGSPSAALRGVATTLNQELPASGAERAKWVVRHPEARDLAVWSVSEPYAEARRRLGLGG